MNALGAGDGQPRLVIKRLELENFKSYAGVQHIGPFHKNLSAIMGPNGSGKSNVIDAMLFVFGRRAKQLRLNKVSELIHNSTHHQNLQQAKVSVFFEEIVETAKDTFETIPNSDLVVSRTASKDNLSHYYVNGKKSSAKEVTELLKSKGIDLENSRFLILQGEVEQISLMKPKGEDEHDSGLLEYLEDIVGTRHYVEHISRAANQLEEFSEERRKHLQLVKVAQGSVDALEEEKEAAEVYRQKEARFYCLNINILKWNRIRCVANVETIMKQLEDIKEKKQYEEGKLAKHSEELKQLQDSARDKDAEVKKLKQEKDVTEKAIRKLMESQATNEKKQEHALKKRDAAESAHKAKLKKLTESEKQLEEAKQEVPIAEAEVQEKQECLDEAQAKLEEMLESVQDESAEIQQRLTRARAAAAPWRSKLQGIRQERDMVATKADLLRKSVLASSKRHEELTAELEIAENELETNRSTLEALKSSCEDHKLRSKEKSAALEIAKKAVAASEAAVSEARSVLQGLASAMASAKTQGQLAKALADAQNRGEIQGLYGRLGDLGSVDAEFDAAASNASGALDNFVVETTEHAQAAVKYLRDKRLGLATFIILDKQRQYQGQVHEQVKTPENVPRLVDLVKCKEEMRVAFFYAFRNTLVAKDIDQASRLGLHGKDRRFARVVTLQGELVAENGTMSGGGSRVTRGKMRLGSSPPVGAQQSQRDCVDAEAKLQELEKQLEQHQCTADQLEAAVKDEQAALQPLCVQVQKEEMAVESLFRKVGGLKQQLKKMKADMAQSSKGDEELQQFEAAVAQHDAEIERVTEDAADAEAAVASVEQELLEVGGQPMQDQRNQVEILKKDVEDAQDAVKKQKAHIESLKKSIKTASAEMKKKVKEVADLDKELSDYHSSNEGAEVQKSELQEHVQEVTERLDTASEELKKVSEQAKSQSEKQDAIEGVVEKLFQAFNDQNKLLKEESDKVNEIDGKIKATQGDLEGALSSVEAITDSEVMSDEEIAAMVEEESDAIAKRLSLLDAQLVADRKKVDLKVLDKYKEKKGDLEKKQADLTEVTRKRDTARSEHDELRKKRLEEFMHGFGIISSKLQEIYQMITIGGDAELNVVDSLDPFSEGIVFEVRPPKKSWKNIRNLSGGEKTLSSLALVFALHHYKPTPLYFMDEIDAALDFKNVSIVANYIKAQTRNAQFVVISLRNHMFELADRLMGIYKVQNCTSSLTIEPHRLCYGKGEDTLQDRPVLQQQRA